MIPLSNAEWRLMNRLWDASPQTITALTHALEEEIGWSKHTIITMLSRLEAKGAVRYEEGARAKQYYPSIEREEAQRGETVNFLDKVYGGKLGLMVSALADSRSLTKEDIDELTAILRKAGEDA